MIQLAMPIRRNVYDELLAIFRGTGDYAGYEREMVRLGTSRSSARWIWENIGTESEECGSSN